MTATLDRSARHQSLTARLTALRAEYDQVQGEIPPPAKGDDADRATNVDAHVRLAVLDDRIAALELEIAAGEHQHSAQADVVEVGDIVSVDFGDGPEQFLLDSVEKADALDVITPASPLGRAVEGAKVGSTVSYRIGSRTLEAKIVALS